MRMPRPELDDEAAMEALWAGVASDGAKFRAAPTEAGLARCVESYAFFVRVFCGDKAQELIALQQQAAEATLADHLRQAADAAR